MLFQVPQALQRHMQKFCVADIDQIDERMSELKGVRNVLGGMGVSESKEQIVPDKKRETTKIGDSLQQMVQKMKVKKRQQIERNLEKQRIKRQLQELDNLQVDMRVKQKEGDLQRIRRQRQQLDRDETALQQELKRFQQNRSLKLPNNLKSQAKPVSAQDQIYRGFLDKGMEIAAVKGEKQRLLQHRRQLQSQLLNLKADPAAFVKRFKQQQTKEVKDYSIKQTAALAENLEALKAKAANPKAQQYLNHKLQSLGAEMIKNNREREYQIQKGHMPVKVTSPQVPMTRVKPRSYQHSHSKLDYPTQQEQQSRLSAIARVKDRQNKILAQKIQDFQKPIKKSDFKSDPQELADSAQSLHIASKNLSTPSQNLLYLLTCQELDQLKILQQLTPGTPIYEFRYRIFKQLQMQRMKIYNEVQNSRIEDIRQQKVLVSKYKQRDQKRQEYIDEQRKYSIQQNLSKDIKRAKQEGEGRIHFLYFITPEDLNEVRLSYSITDRLNNPINFQSDAKELSYKEREYLAIFHPEARNFQFDVKFGAFLVVKIQYVYRQNFKLYGWSVLDMRGQGDQPRVGKLALQIFKPPFNPNSDLLSKQDIPGAKLYIEITRVNQSVNVDYLYQSQPEPAPLESVVRPGVSLILNPGPQNSRSANPPFQSGKRFPLGTSKAIASAEPLQREKQGEKPGKKDRLFLNIRNFGL